jgi:hypothetical protein
MEQDDEFGTRFLIFFDFANLSVMVESFRYISSLNYVMFVFEEIPDTPNYSSKIIVMSMTETDNLCIGSGVWFPAWKAP